MSIKLMSVVWEHANLEGAQLLVLLALADFANDEGYCWPSYDTLAKKARVSRRYAITVVQKLRELGYVTASHRKDSDGNWTSNGYVVEIDRLVNRDHQVVNRDHGGSDPQITRVVIPSSPKPSCEPYTLTETTPSEQKTPSPSQAMFGALAETCSIDWRIATGQVRGALNQSEKKLREIGATPAQVKAFRTWWDRYDWRGKKGDAPRPEQVRDTWGKFKETAKKQGRALEQGVI